MRQLVSTSWTACLTPTPFSPAYPNDTSPPGCRSSRPDLVVNQRVLLVDRRPLYSATMHGSRSSPSPSVLPWCLLPEPVDTTLSGSPTIPTSTVPVPGPSTPHCLGPGGCTMAKMSAASPCLCCSLLCPASDSTNVRATGIRDYDCRTTPLSCRSSTCSHLPWCYVRPGTYIR